MPDRRRILKGGAALAASAALPAFGTSSAPARFPKSFLWGAATAGHQVEGNDTASDTWFLGNISPTVFAEPVGDSANSYHLWPQDLDLCKAMGLNSYRFSVEWSRIEPEKGRFSRAALDHYRRMVDGCRARGLKAIVTFNHFTNPRWFAAAGGWFQPDAAEIFARYCDIVARALADGISHALTFNEPNLPALLETIALPPQVRAIERAMLKRAAELTGGTKFVASNVVLPEDVRPLSDAMLAGHRRARAAIKAVRGDLPVGVSLAMVDDQAGGPDSMRDQIRQRLYGDWLEVARGDDFLGVQNYERVVWGPTGKLPAPADARRGHMGGEVYAASLAGAARYAYEKTKVPILVSEHGVGTNDDTLRAWLIPEALRHLHAAMADGVPVLGYCHWSLLDNFEWIFGYQPKFGLHSVDRKTFQRKAKPSAGVYGAIARSNAV